MNSLLLLKLLFIFFNTPPVCCRVTRSHRSEARWRARRSRSSTTSGRTSATMRTRATTRRSRASTSQRARWERDGPRTPLRVTTRAPSPTRARPSSARAQFVLVLVHGAVLFDHTRICPELIQSSHACVLVLFYVTLFVCES